jgi:hypothetical protein
MPPRLVARAQAPSPNAGRITTPRRGSLSPVAAALWWVAKSADESFGEGSGPSNHFISCLQSCPSSDLPSHLQTSASDPAHNHNRLAGGANQPHQGPCASSLTASLYSPLHWARFGPLRHTRGPCRIMKPKSSRTMAQSDRQDAEIEDMSNFG